MSRVRYFHGGPKGRERGGFLLPPSITRAACMSDIPGIGADSVHRRDRVYLTTSYDAAMLYASVHRKGVVYEAAPVGDVEPDPDCTEAGMSFQCERARVLRISTPTREQVAIAHKALMYSNEYTP